MTNTTPSQWNSCPNAAPRAVVQTALGMGLALMLSACGTNTGPAQASLAYSPGAVQLNQTRPVDVPIGGGGTGTVFFNGKMYGFSLGGMGVDGSAVAIIRTTGEVYRLVNIVQFPGNYRRAPSAAVVPGQSGGGLWLQNEHATVLHLADPPGGRMPDIGSDSLRIVLDR